MRIEDKKTLGGIECLGTARGSFENDLNTEFGVGKPSNFPGFLSIWRK
jgi:hypothetical protein